MSLTCDRALANALRKIPDKQGKMEYIVAQLGPNRLVRAWYDSHANAKYPSLTGTEFLNLSMNGTLTLVGADLTGLGAIFKNNIFLSNINLSTGAASMRIEGNGHFVQGSLGLISGFDFNLATNPDPAVGIAFAATTALSAPLYNPSGTGPEAPPKVASSPHVLKVYDWSNPRAPRLAASAAFTVRRPDYVFEDADMAREHGDAGMYQTPEVLWDNFAFGGTLLISNEQNTEVGNIPLYEVGVNWRRAGSWRSYPQNNMLVREAMVANPPPCKIDIEDENGNVLYTWQMHDGSPFNDFRLVSGNLHRGGRSATAALQPQFNAAMMLYWQNTRPRMTDFIKKIYPGLRNYRPSMSKSYLSIIGIEPLLTGGYDGNTANGLGLFWVAPKWPGADAAQPITDPYASPLINGAFSASHNAWAIGYGYEPAAFGGHNWYTSPGGPRMDRAAINSILAMYLSDPNGMRLQGNVPWRELIDEFNKNSFNHSNHWVFNAGSMQSIPVAEAFNDGWTADGTYYGNYPRPKAVQMNGDQRGGTVAVHYDIDGNMQWAGWARDPLHDYHNRGWASMTFCGSMHGLTSKFDLLTSQLLHNNPFDAGSVRGDYMVRVMAWHWLHYVVAWKNGSKHPDGVSQQTIEDQFARILDAIYKYHYKPIFIDNEDSAYARGMRNMGLGLQANGNKFSEPGGHLGFYLGHVLQLMKQTGFWHKMINRGTVYETVLKNLIRNMDTFCFGNLADAQGQTPPNGANDYYWVGSIANPNAAPTQADLDTIPTSWADWYNKNAGQYWHDSDYVHNTYYDDHGVLHDYEFTAEQDVSSNMFEQYARMRRDFFPEIAHPKMDAAIAELDRYEGIVTAVVNAVPNTIDKYLKDHTYRYPGISPFLGPQKPSDLVTKYPM